MSPTGSQEWQDFLDNVQKVRIELHCSASSAWYRGHSDSSWLLLPTILREYVLGKVGDIPCPPSHLTDEEFREVADLTKSHFIYRLRVSADQSKAIKLLLAEAKTTKKELSRHAKEVVELKQLLTLIPKSRIGEKISLNFSKLSDLVQRHKIPVVLPGNSTDPAAAMLKGMDEAKIKSLLDFESAEQKRYGARLDSLRIQLRATIAVAYGERDAFTEFNFRLSAKTQDSWSTLALMQHYGTSTRLLDWTESLFVGLWFALKNYIAEVEKTRRQDPNLQSASIVTSVLEKTKGAKQPSLWIMNPYGLSQAATGQNRISDFTLGKGVDYYQAFFQEGWQYSVPVPIYSPWREANRLSSQYAMFTVHGTDLRPLDEQAGSKVLKKIDLSQDAAVFGAYQLNSIFPTDRFSLFKDLDSLGKVINDRHIDR